MPARLHPILANRHSDQIIEPQCDDGSTPTGGFACDERPRRTPLKMLVPRLFVWVKEFDLVPGVGIDRVGLAGFVVIAKSTR